MEVTKMVLLDIPYLIQKISVFFSKRKFIIFYWVQAGKCVSVMECVCVCGGGGGGRGWVGVFSSV